jgi:hypothetical protein
MRVHSLVAGFREVFVLILIGVPVLAVVAVVAALCVAVAFCLALVYALLKPREARAVVRELLR